MTAPRSRWALLVPVGLLAVAAVLLWWRGPEWDVVRDVFTTVSWTWVVAAIGLNLLSIVVRAASWHTVIKQALPAPRPRYRTVFSAFCVGLLANVVLPGRAGELVRVAVLARRMPERQGIWATLIGSVFAHRLFDLFPALTLVVWVLLTAKLPHWAMTSLWIAFVVGFGLLTFAIVEREAAEQGSAGGGRHGADGAQVRALGPARDARAGGRRDGARVPVPRLGLPARGGLGDDARVRHRRAPVRRRARAGDDQRRDDLPLWPGNVGLVQAAVALPLRQYGVPYARGFAFGIGLQAIEASVGVCIGLIFLAREGLSYASLKRMPDERGDAELDEAAVEQAMETEPARARMPG